MTNQVEASVVKAPAKKKKIASLDRRKSRAGWLFVLPFLIGLVLIYIPIIFDSIKYSFHEIKILVGGGYELEWVGWKNYSDAILVDTSFVTTLVSGLKQLVLEQEGHLQKQMLKKILPI